jgi:hypothetical protein
VVAQLQRAAAEVLWAERAAQPAAQAEPHNPQATAKQLKNYNGANRIEIEPCG